MKQLLLIVPPSVDVALFGAQPFFTDGINCYLFNGNGRRGRKISKPSWYSMPLDTLIDA